MSCGTVTPLSRQPLHDPLTACPVKMNNSTGTNQAMIVLDSRMGTFMASFRRDSLFTIQLRGWEVYRNEQLWKIRYTTSSTLLINGGTTFFIQRQQQQKYNRCACRYDMYYEYMYYVCIWRCIVGVSVHTYHIIYVRTSYWKFSYSQKSFVIFPYTFQIATASLRNRVKIIS